MGNNLNLGIRRQSRRHGSVDRSRDKPTPRPWALPTLSGTTTLTR
jgi:hypothetical protein